MKKLLKQIWFGAVLIVFSVSTYYIHYLIFHDSHHIFIFLVGDIAFVFIEVLMVTMIIHKVFENMEKQSRMKKLNMVIGVFFSEMGTTLLSHFSDLDLNLDEIRRDLIVSSNWTDTDFLKVAEKLKRYPCRIEPSKLSVDEISCYLAENHGLMLQMMGNPNLMEHE
ncbi:MAG: hypothetical protein U9P80_08065, partial [Thermodesulfobacteriota bacterium]|nr:hypothetical protein [Thermodesulfobacteriota bacterium]